ncbi:MAG: hypothetical protein MJ171_00270 [Clostridia bacterium]|nr:hypothetical protein [Clostridia bacterium]
MKKIISVIMVFVIILSFAACGGSGSGGNDNGGSNASNNSSTGGAKTYSMENYIIMHKADGGTSEMADLSVIGDKAEDWTLYIDAEFKTFKLTHLDRSLTGTLVEDKTIAEQAKADKAYAVSFDSFSADFFHCTFDNASLKNQYLLIGDGALTFTAVIGYQYYGGYDVTERNMLIFNE